MDKKRAPSNNIDVDKRLQIIRFHMEFLLQTHKNRLTREQLLELQHILNGGACVIKINESWLINESTLTGEES